MYRTAFLIALLAFALAGCQKQQESTSATAGGRLEVASATFDNGVTPRGDAIKHVFELKNVGDAPVKITDTRASCSCTAAVVSDPVVMPGATASVEVSFNTRGRRGQQSKTVKVFTDSALTPWLSLTVTGDIRPAVAFSEDMVQFGRVPRGTTVERELDLAGLKAEGVTIGELTLSPADDTRISASVVDGSEGRKLKVTFKSEGKTGYFRGRVDATTSSAEYPSVFLTVLAEVTGDIVAEPRTAVFPPRKELSEAEKKTQQVDVVLKSLSGKDFKVKGMQDEKNLVRLVSVKPLEGGGMGLVLEGPLDAQPGEGVLVFEIKDGEPFEMDYVVGRGSPGKGRSHEFKGDRVGKPPRVKPGKPAFKPGSGDSLRRNPRVFDVRKRQEGAGNH